MEQILEETEVERKDFGFRRFNVRDSSSRNVRITLLMEANAREVKVSQPASPRRGCKYEEGC